MELYVNEQKLKGFVGKDAEVFATKNQSILVVFSLATKSGYKDRKTNQWVNRTEWHRIVAVGEPANHAKDMKKGDYAEVVGETQTNPHDREIGDGKKKIKVTFRDKEVRASLVKKLAKPESSHAENLDAEPITEDDAA
ncbi:single-stranded DNA-binding protein [Paracidobacterium acidisoli]|uniref:Single-stranded DNA-binding protein n=1 Tax=Paracidobacterium acidisoli TaxID=2303751 RepID=A0A372IP51_9BACT|nr:single-stranded DNA-binding protein [Paracidobacterium acidisoli]MBT9332018.1 single-stranded DNA-binding protein [Paracidobacterium acidisoli]